MRSSLLAAMVLAVFASVGTGLVALTHWATAPRIQANTAEAMRLSLEALLANRVYDNDILAQAFTVAPDPCLGHSQPVWVYPVRQQGRTTALIFAARAPKGYAGPIDLLIAIAQDGAVVGVRVVAHQETPGLGDDIELRRSDWILGFNERSLTDPALTQWGVRRDGGVFDQFTGATITARAVVHAVRDVLRYVALHPQLWHEPTEPS